MNPELLRHFQTHTPEEQHYLEYYRAHGVYPLDQFDREQYERRGTYPAQRNDASATFVFRGERLISMGKQRRFQHCPEHTHNYVEMVYMCSGQTTHLVNGNEITMSAGELLILNQHARHENMPAEENDIAVNFTILPRFFDITLAMMGDAENGLRKFLLDCLHNENYGPGFLRFRVADVPQMQSQIESLLWAQINKERNRRSIEQYAMGVLCLYLLNHTDKISTDSPQDDLALKILQYVEENYKDGTLTDLAKRLNYDMAWLSKEIKRLTGTSFKKLQFNRRLSQAKFLLGATNLPIAEIAKQAGFANLTLFYKSFREQAGCSPAQYRDGNALD